MTTEAALWRSFAASDSDACTALTTISHVAHLRAATRIVSDGKIRSGLVYDQSRLRETRTCVVWLSPNQWIHGSRYGNVSFDFDWKKLVEGRHAYRVEVAQYSPKAPRILLTTKEYPDLSPYDPTKRSSGPWWHRRRDDTHWWNGAYTLEVLIDDDLPVEKSSRVSFVPHHPNQCCNDYSKCKSRGWSSRDGALRFITEIASTDADIENNEPGGACVPALDASDLESVWSVLYRRIRVPGKFRWKKSSTHPSAVGGFARMGLRAAGREDFDALRACTRHFKDADALTKEWQGLILTAFPTAITAAALPLDPV